MDEVIDGTLGTVKVGFGKIMDGTLDSTNKLIVNSSGEALTKDTNTRTSVASIDTKTPALGQALAAASVPVILPSATVTTLTPPTNTGYALDASLTTIDTDLKSNVTLHAGANIIGKVGIDQTTPGTTNGVSVTDGTNTVNVLKSDGTAAGQNAQIIASTSLSVAFTTTTAQAVASTDAANYSWVSVHITSQGTSSVVNFQASNDNTNWVAVPLFANSGTTSAGGSNTSSTATILHGPLQGRYFRLNVTGISAGTTAGTIIFSTMPKAVHELGATVVQATAANLKVDISGTAANATAIKVDGSAVTQPVSGTVTANQGGTWTVQPGNTANTTAWKVDGSAVTQPVSLTSTTVTGTVAVTESGTWNVGASTATGSAVPANAMYAGVNARTSLPTAATAGNLTGLSSDKFGRVMTIEGTIRDLVGTQTTTISASTSETTIVTAAASTFNDLTALVVSNTSVSATRVDFRDTTAGSILFSLYIPAGDVRGVAFQRPVPQTTVNTNWSAQSSVSVTDLRVYAVFDKNA